MPPEFPLPPILTHPSSSTPLLIAQGAEGRLYKTTHLSPSRPSALKYRPPKPYRHPILDARLTKARIAAEAKILDRCLREGVAVPAVYALDAAAGWMMVEWIEGWTVRQGINWWLGGRESPREHADEGPLVRLMGRIGAVVAGLHGAGVVHGDLTTSNMMLRGDGKGDGDGDGVEGEVVLIDFGLASQSVSEEDRAVDLYVLERAFASTHPRAERLFGEVLRVYGERLKKGGTVLRKLEDVRMRGRKRSMLG